MGVLTAKSGKLDSLPDKTMEKIYARLVSTRLFEIRG